MSISLVDVNIMPVILANVNGNIHKNRPLHSLTYSCRGPGYIWECPWHCKIGATAPKNYNMQAWPLSSGNIHINYRL